MYISSEEMFKKIKEYKNSEDFLVLDVRTYFECISGMISGSVNIELSELVGEEGIFLKQNLKDIYIICAHGIRAVTAMNVLNKNKNIKVNVYVLENGISDWKLKGFPLDI